MKKTKRLIRCVTTMSQEYYNVIGKVMIATWLENFKEGYTLHLYLEDFTVDISDPRVIIEDWNDVNTLFQFWKSNNHGPTERQEKFTMKALTQIAAWRKYSGKMLWLDADTFSIKLIPLDFFDRIIENYPLASWGDDSFESGTVFIDSDHPDFKLIREIYESVYLGEIGLPEGQRWFDGELLGWACVQAGRKHLNLWKHCKAKTSTPLNRSWIGDYIKHMKAKQKNTVKETLINDFNRIDLAEMLN